MMQTPEPQQRLSVLNLDSLIDLILQANSRQKHLISDVNLFCLGLLGPVYAYSKTQIPLLNKPLNS
jgi:hypothetical protein